MLHQQTSSALRRTVSAVSDQVFPATPASFSKPAPRSLRLVEGVSMADPAGGFVTRHGGFFPAQAPAKPRILVDILSASAGRFAAFCAEASVLVFVLGILDRFLLKERIEIRWIVGAFTVSVVLLALSVATDVSARRWLAVTRPGPIIH
jgi:hypothetical protein